MEEQINTILKKYNIVALKNTEQLGKAMGLGDLMFAIRSIKQGLQTKPLYININAFIPNYTNPVNSLEMRIIFLRELLEENNLPPETVQYIRNPNVEIDQSCNWDEINFDEPLQLRYPPIPKKLKNKKYIVIHTKCRLTTHINYNLVKEMVKDISSKLYFNIPIVLLGEKTFPDNIEHQIHGITTVYNELQGLKEHNTVYDLTQGNIIDNLNFEQFKMDVAIMRDAALNIHFGLGGSFSASISFCKNTISFIPRISNNSINREKIKKSNIYMCDEPMEFVKQMITLLSSIYSNLNIPQKP